MPPRRTRERKGRRGRPSLLILQLDSRRLESGGLSLAAGGVTAAEIVRRFHEMDVEVIEAADERSLIEACVRVSGRRFDVVVVIGHSSESGIRLASDRFATWEVFTEGLRPLKPRRVILVACRAGRALPAQTLFDGLRDLRRIYASPMAVTKLTGQLLLAVAPYLVLNRVPSVALFRAAQAALAIFTGGQLREWTRNEDHRNPTSLVWDLIADAI